VEDLREKNVCIYTYIDSLSLSLCLTHTQTHTHTHTIRRKGKHLQKSLQISKSLGWEESLFSKDIPKNGIRNWESRPNTKDLA
jgi:hypothetical protein